MIKDGRAFLQATTTMPPDSQAAYTLVDKVRTTVHAIGGAEAKVGGGTAINQDVESAAAHDRDLLIPLILGVVLLILGLLLRAIVAPLVLIATVVLSFASALGISALFFKHASGFAGAGGIHRDRIRGRTGRPARHDHRALGARDRADLGYRPSHLVAQRAGAP